MQSILHTACVVSYNSKDCRRTLGGGQGRPWNTRPKPSLIANVSAAFERVCMCVCTHIYDSVCVCLQKKRKKNMDTGIYMVFVNN